MKTRSWVMGYVLALVVLFAGAGLAQATVLFSDDFTGLNAGDLNGQNGDGGSAWRPSITGAR